MLIGVVGDFQPGNQTHKTLNQAPEHAAADAEWIPTNAVPSPELIGERFAGLWIAPASPYRSMEGALTQSRRPANGGCRWSAPEAGFSTY